MTIDHAQNFHASLILLPRVSLPNNIPAISKGQPLCPKHVTHIKALKNARGAQVFSGLDAFVSVSASGGSMSFFRT